MRLRFAPQAARDLTEIADFIRVQNPAAAQRVRHAILATLNNLTLFPKLGRKQNMHGARKVITRQYRYLIYYLDDAVANEIIVLTIQHPSRKRERDDF